jgi:hypothetical protein
MAKQHRHIEAEPQYGFLLHIEPCPGFTLGEARELDRRIQDCAEAHELELQGGQLLHIVSSEDRSLTATDQVDLMDWLINQSGISVVRLSTLTEQLDPSQLRSVWQAGYAQASVCDLGLIGLSILYRARRITAELYLQILGGFVRKVERH